MSECAAPESAQVVHLWFGAKKSIVRSVPSVGTARCSVDEVIRSGNCLRPESGWNIALENHASGFVEKTPILSFGDSVLMGRPGLRELSNNACVVTKLVEGMGNIFPPLGLSEWP